MVYRIPAERIRIRKRLARVGFAIVLFFVVVAAFHVFWPSQFSSRPLTNYWEDILIAAITAFFLDSVRKESSLVATDETISIRSHKISERKVRKGHICYFHECAGNFFREPSLRLSEHGGLGRFFWGYLSIPTSLPEYQQIKTLAMTWMKIN